MACIQSLAEHMASWDPELVLPYEIQGDRIGDLSVTCSNEVYWTQAMKYVLTDIKWLLAWTIHCFE